MATPRGKWPVESSDQFHTTCSQCHTAISTPSDSGPVICPRCKAMIESRDGQPFGIPRYTSPLSGETMPDLLERAIDPGWPDDGPQSRDEYLRELDESRRRSARPDTTGMTEDEAFEARYGMTMEEHATDLIQRIQREEARNALLQRERLADRSEEPE